MEINLNEQSRSAIKYFLLLIYACMYLVALVYSKDSTELPGIVIGGMLMGIILLWGFY